MKTIMMAHWFKPTAGLLLSGCLLADAATLTMQTNVLGPTPTLLGYNLGHFYPGSNTRDWWRYSGVTGARIFIGPTSIEPSSYINGAAALVGVSNQTSFFAARAAMHTNQFNPNYIPWSVITNNYNNTDLYPVNHIKISPALTALRSIGVQICPQITATASAFPIASSTDWPNLWGLWHHYYAQAFYMGRYFDVQRYQIYNEPNNVSGFTMSDLLLRTQFASDAIQSALADVNALYGKSLQPLILSPTLAGNAISSFPDWGTMMVTNRHLNIFGLTDTNYLMFQKYDYHQYGSSPTGFGGNLATLNAGLQSLMAPEAPFATTVTEFDTRTAASFDATTTTLDTPTEYPKFGGICVELMSNLISEAYCFKFSQVTYSGNYPIQKNALHYVENNSAPYNVGGITKAGEVYRLFNQGFAPGRQRLNVQEDTAAAALETCASYDPATQRYYVFSANNNPSNANLNVDLSAFNLPTGNKVLIQEVSESSYGGGVLWTNLPASSVVSAVQGSNTVWLLTVSGQPESAEQLVAASDNAEVRNGLNSSINYAGATNMTARNDPASANNRRVAFMKFHLPTNSLTNLDFAELSLQAGCATSNCTAQAHVYFLTSTNWSSPSITWNNAPNLKQNMAAGVMTTNDVINGQDTNAYIVGQIVVTSTNVSEKLIDLTGFLRGQTNQDFTLMVVQDPRWDLTLSTQTLGAVQPGDIQPDGVQIITAAGGAGPQLRLVGLSATNPPTSSYWTNLSDGAEANIQGGTYANTNVDEAAQGYLMVKYYASPFSSARKAYFQFDLTGLNFIGSTSAVFTVGFQAYYHQNVQLWALNQSYPGFNSAVTWNTAQANDPNSNDLLTTGAFTATAIGSVTNIPVGSSVPQSFVIPQIGNYVHGNLLTLALSGVTNQVSFTNDSGGLRIALGSATLSLSIGAPANLPPQITGVAVGPVGQFTLNFSGSANNIYYVQAATNLANATWTTISTNTADANGNAVFTDATTNFPSRFYRVLTP
jgi:hypothetical protein